MDCVTAREIEELEKICPGGLFRNQRLSKLSAWQIGGQADLIIRPNTTSQVALLRSWFQKKKWPHIVFGATTNLLFADEGLRVPAIQIGSALSRCEVEGTTLCVHAGAWVPGVSRFAMQHGLTGIEHVVGIPGTFGGLVAMNGGSKRLSIGASIIEVESVTIQGDVKRRLAQQCAFHYRSSVFQSNNEIVTSATITLARASKKEIRRNMIQILKDRNNKFPRKLPNCGSVFKSNPEMYNKIGTPGSAIQRVGLKGFQIGGAQFSTRHANFIVNNGGATSADIYALVALARAKVEQATGFGMEAEVLFVSPDGKISPVGT
jgi:UDP-N-acetylmuramate dehydrogenase